MIIIIIIIADDDYDDDDNNEDDDDIYIMVRCMSVCYEKAPLSVFKRFCRFSRL